MNEPPSTSARPIAEVAARQALRTACGHLCVQAGGLLWHSVGGRVFSADEACLRRPSAAAIRNLLRKARFIAAVFWTSAASGRQAVQHRIGVAALPARPASRQFRQKVRKASSVYSVRRMSWDEWRILALACDRSTLAGRRLDHAPLLDDGIRAAVVDLAEAAANLEIYGCFAGPELAAYIICAKSGRVLEGLLMHWDRAAPRAHATHALYHGFLEAQAGRTDIDDISLGPQWIFPNAGSDFFKRQAGLAERPCHVGVLLHPWLAPFLETRAAALAASAARRLLAPYWSGAQKLELIELAWRTREALQRAERAAADGPR